MKIVFLDIDGVLNSELTKGKLDKKYYELLKKLVEVTDCYFVVSSSWRCMNLDDTKWELSGHIAETNKKNKNRASKLQDPFPQWLIDRIVGITPRMYAFVGSTAGFHFMVPRGVEVEHYIIMNEIRDQYAIIDDDNDFLIYQQEHLIVTDNSVGLTEDDINRCIDILNTPR